MANGVIVQFAVPSVLAAIALCILIVYMRRKAQPEPSHGVTTMPAVTEQTRVVRTEVAPLQQPEVELEALPPIPTPTPEPPLVVDAQPLMQQENHNQRILAGISENIRRSTIKPAPTYSPLQFPETPRDTEYVRVKKKIITPHGKVRFSILKDSISTNMLAVFRRACLDWKTPQDLISFLPPYLEPEAEILDNQILLIGTPGHDEKLAIPIRGIDPGSFFRECFDFVTDDRTASNTPAVLLTNDDQFEIVSRGVITQPVFLSLERDRLEMKLLVEKSPELLLNG